MKKIMSRKEAVEEQQRLFPLTPDGERRCPTLPEICLDLRAGINGQSSPTWTDQQIEETINMLRARIRFWEDSMLSENVSMDSAIVILTGSAISYGKYELARRSKLKDKENGDKK